MIENFCKKKNCSFFKNSIIDKMNDSYSLPSSGTVSSRPRKIDDVSGGVGGNLFFCFILVLACGVGRLR
jgi:hypothetical protein